MGQSKRYSTKEVSVKLDIPQSTLRRWEEYFNLKIPRREDESRSYTQDNLKEIVKIKKMRKDGKPMGEIKESLELNEQEFDEKRTVEKVNHTAMHSLIEGMFSEKEQVHKEEGSPGTEELLLTLKGLLEDNFKNELKKEVIEAVKEEVEKNMKDFFAIYKSEVNRRDELLTENIRLRKKLKELEKKPGLFKVFS